MRGIVAIAVLLIALTCDGQKFILRKSVDNEKSDEKSVTVNATAINQQLFDLLKLGKAQDAMNILSGIDTSIMQLPETKINQARAFAQLNKFSESELLLQQIVKDESQLLKQDSENMKYISLAKLTLGKLYYQQKRVKEAQYFLEQAVRQSPQIPNNPQKSQTAAEAYLFLGKVFLLRDQSSGDKARKYIEMAVYLNPGDERFQFEYGMILFYSQEPSNYEKGRQAFEKALQINPSMDCKLVGKVYLHFGQTAWARSAFLQALLQATTTKYDQLSDEERQQRQRGERMDPRSMTVQTLSQTVSSSPILLLLDDPLFYDEELYLLLGEIEDALGHLAVSRGYYDRVLARNPSQPVAHAGLGLLTLGINNYNYGSLTACGHPDRQVAIQHFQQALTAAAGRGGGGGATASMKVVQQAMQQCQREMAEVAQWQEIVQRDYHGIGAEGDDDKQERARLQLASLAAGGANNKRWWQPVAKTVRQVLQVLGLCRGRGDRGGGWIQTAICQPLHHHSGQAANSQQQKQKQLTRSQQIQLTQRHWQARARSMTSSRSSHANSSNIDEVSWDDDGMNLAAFHAQYMLANRPAVIVQGFQDNWFPREGSSQGGSYYDSILQQLIQTSGAELVRVSVSPTGRFDGPEPASLWSNSSTLEKDSKDILVRPPSTSMRFKDFLALAGIDLTRYEEGQEGHGEDVSKRRKKKQLAAMETFYMEYVALHQYLGQDFLNLVPLPKTFTDYLQEEKESLAADKEDAASASPRPDPPLLQHLVSNVWIGSKPTTSPLHYDDYENFLCQVTGQKELILYPPQDLAYLYYLPRRKGNLLYSYPNTFTRNLTSGTAEQQQEQREVIFGSSINIDALQSIEDEEDTAATASYLARYPLYRHAHPRRVVLQPGHCLYLPAYWHHEVQSLPHDAMLGTEREDDEEVQLNIAINFWYRNVTYPIDEAKIFAMQQQQ